MCFGPFVLDERRALLTRAGVLLTLRPKTFALLSFLVAQAGRVVGKEELLRAVWPGVVVTDDSLSQCVRELRGALGDEQQALIKTVPRRGYLFRAAVQTAAPLAPSVPTHGRHRMWLAVATAAALLLGGLMLAAQRRDASPVGVDQAIKARRSIAVLPFSELGSAGWFAEAIVEDLVTDLAKLPDTLVIARNSAAAVGARETDVRRIGRELGARHVLSGSVRRDGAAVQINAQFASAESGAVLWSERFEYRDVADWAWQRDIGLRIARALDLQMTTEAAKGRRSEQRLDAIEATLLGQHELRQAATYTDLLRARAHFERALAIEPDSASALTGLAQSHLRELESFWGVDDKATIVLAEQAIKQARAAAPDYLPAQAAAGDVLRERRAYEDALRVYEQVVTVNPSDAWSHARIGTLKLYLGRLEEVAAHADAARRVSPLESALVGYSQLYAAQAEYYLGREDAAYERLRQSAGVGASPTQLGALLWLTALDGLQGRDAEARQHLAQLLRVNPRLTIDRWLRATAPVHPRLQPGRERLVEGLRKAGLPD